MELDAEEVEEELGNMWRTMHKLSRTFADSPNPKRSAEITKSKLDKFKQHLPLLQTFCNPGIRDRHWKRVREGEREKGERERERGKRERGGGRRVHVEKSNRERECV